MSICKSAISPKIDTRPPILFVENVLHSTKLVHDIRRQREIARDNKELLKRINKINRTEGFLGVKYDYKPKKLLHLEARKCNANQIEQDNLALLQRILNVKPEINASAQEKSYQKLIKYRIICNKFSKQTEKLPRKSKSPTCSRIRMELFERTDRKLGSIKININVTALVDHFRKERINCLDGSIHRIYQNQYIVIRGHFGAVDYGKESQRLLLEHVGRGSLLRATVNDQPALLITLKTFPRLANCELIGIVDDDCERMLNVLNFYGSTNGRTLEPLCFRVKIDRQ
ncbi:uncharacterized protein LOC135704284 [Ochlerotatus camptorhynchus]|uniref:uncharacterized protein LOC135704284 n=1 Tax=Ochlerotatus camptorhynchus TaxID=644619 RepID=UPI0031E232CD